MRGDTAVIKTRMIWSLIAVAMLTVSSVGVCAEQPQKHRWASFPVGSWVLLRTVAREGGAGAALTRSTLLEVRPDVALVEMEMDINGSTAKQTIPFHIP